MKTKNFQMSKLDLEKTEELDIKVFDGSNICWIIEKTREFQKTIDLYFINYAKVCDYVDHNKLWKALKVMGVPDHLTCFLRNLYAGQETTVRTMYGTNYWFKIEKGV